jgi:hypothetical protein
MPGLPSNLDTQCRNILLRCHEFEDYRSLRTLFIAEPLFAFRIGLPSADNPADLVDRCLDYLVDKRLRDGRPVLPIFLATLRDRYQPGDALHDDLHTLYGAVQTAMAPQGQPPAQAPHRAQHLFDMLLRLNFGEQVRIAKQVIETHRIAAFLVHGEPECGQQLLVNRLIRLSPGWQTGQRICIDAGSNGVGKSSHSLWRQVASKLGMAASTSPAVIAEKVCEWWQTQDVIFIFHTVDYMPPILLSAWVQEFWQPVVVAAHCRQHLAQRDTHLLLFLVDYSGCVCGWNNFALAHQSDQADYPRIPLHLPPAGRFTPDVIDFWIDMAAEILPSGLTSQLLLAVSDNGIPQIIYDAICDHCGLSWEGELIKWLS